MMSWMKMKSFVDEGRMIIDDDGDEHEYDDDSGGDNGGKLQLINNVRTIWTCIALETS